jgi:cyclophilin family peptidyl-prolyl cis-trans isomerase
MATTTSSNNNIPFSHRRTFGSGARGARGLGWYQKYRDGRGGRHLQGRHHDLESRDVLEQLNNSIFNFGSSWHYIKLQVEENAKQEEEKQDEEQQDQEEQQEEKYESNGDGTGDDTDDGASKDDTTTANAVDAATPPTLAGSTIYELRLELATVAMPLTTQNFQLLAPQYVDTIVHRIEKKVGLCLGDVRNTQGKSGYCHPSLSQTGKLLETEPKVLSHLEGIVSMISSGVDKVDSRFLLCTHDAYHLDGRFVPFGRLAPESLEICKELERTQMTRLGLPNFEIKIIECGPILDVDGGGEENEEQQAA